MPPPLTSELAGLSTALLWAIAAICWAELSRRLHPTTVATVRLVLAVAFLLVLHLAWFGCLWPVQVPSWAFWTLCLAGVSGAGIGDILYIHSIQRIGPRMTMTLTTLAPVVAALLAWLLPMHEHMSGQAILGMLLTVGGVSWVVAEKRGPGSWPSTPASFRRGVLLGLLCVFFQAVGFVCSRIGMNAFTVTPVPAFSASLIRVTAACLWCCAVTTWHGQTRAAIGSLRHRGTLAWLLVGVITGPVAGIWLSMIALQGAATGVASTLLSLSPLFLIPLSWICYGERPTLHRILATLVALGGIACMLGKG